MKNSLVILSAVVTSTLNLLAIDALPSIPAVSLKTIDTILTTSKSNKVDLVKGWNMVSVPGYDTVNVADIFSNSTYVNTVYYYDSSISNYTRYVPNDSSSNLSSIKPSNGVWVYANVAFSLTFNVSVESSCSSSSTVDSSSVSSIATSSLTSSSSLSSSSSSSATTSQTNVSSTATSLENLKLIADYNFNGTFNDSINDNAVLQTLNTEFVDNAIYSNGVYTSTFDTDNLKGGSYIITPNLENLSYNNFTINLKFKPLSSGNIMVGGTSYRWFSIISGSDNTLEFTFNNQRESHILSDAKLIMNEWNTLIVSVDIGKSKVITYLNNSRLNDITLPSTFSYSVIGTYAESRDKQFTFSNFSNGMTFKGYVDYLKIYDNSLTN